MNKKKMDRITVGGVEGRHYTLAILYLICLVSYIDRQLIALLAPDIQRELGLDDWQLGFVSGTSFALFYVLMAIPLSYAADRHSRVHLLGWCLLGWSAMTAACGAVASFIQLSFARVGVAVGEAGGYPASLSLIGDLYPAHQRATVTSIYFSAVPAGTLFSLYVGGIVAEAIGWRMAFVAAAVPGVLLALILMTTVREPARGASEAGLTTPAPAARSVGHAFALLRESLAKLFRDPFYRTTAIAALFAGVGLFAVIVWAPTYAIRAFGLGTAEVGRGIGLSTGFISVVVMIVAGGLADRLSRRSEKAPVLIAALAHSFGAVLMALALKSGDFTVFCILAALAFGSSSTSGPLTIAATQSRVLPGERATAGALLIMMSTLAGYGIGPPLIGAISDLAPGDPAERLRFALLVSMGAPIIASLLLLRAARLMQLSSPREG